MSTHNTLRRDPRPPHLALMLVSMQRALAYRTSTLMSLVTTLIWVAVSYYIWRTVFGSKYEIAAFTWEHMRTYIFLSYAVNMLLSYMALARMMAMIRTGEIASELLRPVDFLAAQLSQTAGGTLAEGLVSSSLILGLGVAFFNLLPPISAAAVLPFAISICLGLLIKFLVSYIVALLCFWTMNSLGLIWMQTAVVNILSGALIPLTFFPPWLQTLARYLPFQGIISTPISIYLGTLRGGEALASLGVQACWVLILYLFARRLWDMSIRSLRIQGG